MSIIHIGDIITKSSFKCYYEYEDNNLLSSFLRFCKIRQICYFLTREKLQVPNFCHSARNRYIKNIVILKQVVITKSQKDFNI